MPRWSDPETLTKEEEMIRTAICILAVALLALTACRQEQPPAEIPRQTTPTPVAPTPSESPAAAAEGQAQLQIPPQSEVDRQRGEQVYQTSCASCHEQGVAGAPAQGNREQWQPRLAKGYETLVANSINGFQGNMGVMPPRGGNANLSDEEVAAAVAYMMEINK
jgi:cytochrome c5